MLGCSDERHFSAGARPYFVAMQLFGHFAWHYSGPRCVWCIEELRLPLKSLTQNKQDVAFHSLHLPCVVLLAVVRRVGGKCLFFRWAGIGVHQGVRNLTSMELQLFTGLTLQGSGKTGLGV